MNADTWLGIGLSLVGLGFPAGITILVYGRRRNGDTKQKPPGSADPCRSHEKRLDGYSERLRQVEMSLGEFRVILPELKDTMRNIKTQLDRLASK